jgi:Na+(H+)/acetate symporter ActP
MRATIVRAVAVGFAVGVVATLAYDVTKAFLSQLDPSPFDPFETTRVFGRILIGSDAPMAAITVVGWAFHLANGTTFAIAFACLFARGGRIGRLRGVATGIGWGLFLETFQLALYPGWLSIGFIDEFRRISFLSHIVFGTILGLLVPVGLRWTDRQVARSRRWTS